MQGSSEVLWRESFPRVNWPNMSSRPAFLGRALDALLKSPSKQKKVKILVSFVLYINHVRLACVNDCINKVSSVITKTSIKVFVNTTGQQ